ncbi:hypothetical protein Ahy_A07g031833 isoform B [Arachis hypogaea]|uniref:Uncharacterized protein n=1 Tax=Arachis hypogaea TaxID=3818 RepID=A0A445C548_ARAHY|nr:hypothetical protein Ahy_A07g031833 isoform B [Arachis hypogaea]
MGGGDKRTAQADQEVARNIRHRRRCRQGLRPCCFDPLRF